MKVSNKFVLSISVLAVAACGGGGGGGGSSAGDAYSTGSSSNSPPTINNTVLNISVMENQTSAFQIEASDADGDTITYNVGGEDQEFFDVSTSGVVTFKVAPDFENPSDANADNVYEISGIASDSGSMTSKDFTVTVTNDPSDDSDSAWNGSLIKDDTYKPYDKHATSYGIIIGGLPDVTDGFMTNVANITNKILMSNDNTNASNRTTLIDNFSRNNFFQRVGSTGMSSYDPALNETNYPGWDNINDNYTVIDFIWEATSKSSAEEKTKNSQINGILEHILHTITLGYDKSFNSWSYDSDTSELNLAMKQAIDMGHYDPSGNYGSLQETDPTQYKRIIAQEFAYWMILTEWDLKSTYAPDSSPEWKIQTASEMSTKLPLAHELYNDTIVGVLVNPTSDYLNGLEFESITSAQTETIQVSIEANNNGSGNVYVIDGTQKKSLTFEVGKTYVFNHSTAHPFRFSEISNGTHGGGTEFTDGVTKSSGTTSITVSSSTPSSLYYYCSVHSGMGGSITIGEDDGY